MTIGVVAWVIWMGVDGDIKGEPLASSVIADGESQAANVANMRRTLE